MNREQRRAAARLRRQEVGRLEFVSHHCDECGAPYCPVCDVETVYCLDCGGYHCADCGYYLGVPVPGTEIEAN